MIATPRNLSIMMALSTVMLLNSPLLRGLVAPIGFSIQSGATIQPKGRNDHRESVLVEKGEPFLTPDQQDSLRNWWIEYQGGTLPTWDLVASAFDASNRPSLVLIEAKDLESNV